MSFGMKKMTGKIGSLCMCLLLCVSMTGCGVIYNKKSPSAGIGSSLRSAVGWQTRDEKICERVDKEDFPSADEIGL